MAEAPFLTLVCGTNYGQRYLDAVRAMPHVVELAGIFALGSVRSMLIAARERVPLWTELSEVPHVDIACAAMGPGGHGSVLGLLERGVHVLHEHPMAPTQLDEAWLQAERSGASLHVNSHFPLLPAPQSFLEESASLQARIGSPSRLRVRSNRRSFYGAIDLVRRSIGALEFVDCRVDKFSQGFFHLETELGGLPTRLELEAGLDIDGRPLPDGASHHLVDIAVELEWRDLALTLTQLAGPVYRSDREQRLDVPQSRKEQAGSRLDANRAALADLVSCARGAEPPSEQRIDHLRDVSRCAFEVSLCLARALES